MDSLLLDPREIIPRTIYMLRPEDDCKVQDRRYIEFLPDEACLAFIERTISGSPDWPHQAASSVLPYMSSSSYVLQLLHLIAMESGGEKALSASFPAGPITSLRHSSPKPLCRRACDSCFATKEKCVYYGPSAECNRCRRLLKACTFNRPTRRTGRRRLLPPARGTSAQQISSRKGASATVPHVLHPFGVLFKDLQPLEEVMVRKMLDPSQFTEFMVVPRVGPRMHHQAMHSFLLHYDEIHDAVFAMYGAFTSAVSMNLPGYDSEANVRRATVALEKLRAFPPPKDCQDFEAWLWLGTSILIHAHCAFGSSAAPVRRYMLSCLDGLGEHGKQFRSHPVIVSLTARDIYECLLYRQMPVMNIPESDLVGNDSFLGLYSPVLRFTYELCKINCHTTVLSEQSRTPEAHGRSAFRELLTSVEEWQPELASPAIGNLSTMEATHIVTQTDVHKRMILLFIHRLRYPFGVEDAPAEQMADSIVSRLDHTTLMTSKAPKMVTLPFLVAAAEFTERGKRDKVYHDIDIYVDGLSPKPRHMARVFLKALWDRRDCEPGFRWIDVMARLPPICVGV